MTQRYKVVADNLAGLERGTTVEDVPGGNVAALVRSGHLVPYSPRKREPELVTSTEETPAEDNDG